MRGRIVFLSHDNLHPIPAFRNIGNFLKAVKSNRITDSYPPQMEYLYIFDNKLMGYILDIYKFYGYQEDTNVLSQIGKENEHYRKILKEN